MRMQKPRCVRQETALSNFDFSFYFALFRRRLPVFITVLVLAGAAFLAGISLWPVSYQATARILVESPQIPTDLAKSTVPTGAAEQFQIIQEDVLSRQNLLDLEVVKRGKAPRGLLRRKGAGLLRGGQSAWRNPEAKAQKE